MLSFRVLSRAQSLSLLSPSASASASASLSPVLLTSSLRTLRAPLSVRSKATSSLTSSTSAGLIQDSRPKWWVATVDYTRLMVNGTKQLVQETKKSMELTSKKELTRREKLHLIKNKADLLGFVPFLVYIALPFSFVLFPVVVSIFPTIVPSVFRTPSMKAMMGSKDGEKHEAATFFTKELLQLAEQRERTSGPLPAGHDHMKAALQDAFRKALGSGLEFREIASLKEVAELFPPESLSQAQARKVLKVMGKSAMLFPQKKLQRELSFIIEDDKMLEKEGVADLKPEEVHEALKQRGYQSMYLNQHSLLSLRMELANWVNFSRHTPASPSLLPFAILLRENDQSPK